MKILVTGAGGYLGRNLAKKLIDSGCEVYALTKTAIDFHHPKYHLIISDLIDINNFKGLDIDYIFHTAALINFDQSSEVLSQLTRNNILATYNLTEFAINNKIKKLIYSSTCSVYDDNFNRNNWITESYPLRPKNTYAISKLASEWILANRLIDSTCELVILRYSSIYGIGQRKGSIIPIFIENASQNLDISIFGSGNRIQNYVYIDDVVKANIDCLKLKIPFNTILNIGSSEQVTDKMLAERIKLNWNSTSQIKILNQSKNPETFLNYDIKKAKRLIGFNPRNLNDGLKMYKND